MDSLGGISAWTEPTRVLSTQSRARIGINAAPDALPLVVPQGLGENVTARFRRASMNTVLRSSWEGVMNTRAKEGPSRQEDK